MIRSIMVATLLALPALAPAQPATRVSRFGEYAGYTAATYDGWVRSSQLIPMRDGIRLAVDILRPTRAGQVESRPLPVIWTFTPYARATIGAGKIATVLDFLPWARELIGHGYVIAAADVRGTGASFGGTDGVFQPVEAQDGYDVTEWLAAQPWSTGKIGMFGLSYLGVTQLTTASAAPPHLVAIMPEMAWFDPYDFMYPGGIYQFYSLFAWSVSNRAGTIRVLLPPKWREVITAGRRSDEARWPNAGCTYVPCAPMGSGQVAPVDDDADGSLLMAAVAEHRRLGSDVFVTYSSLPFRNSTDRNGTRRQYLERSMATMAPGIARSHVAIYHVAGWFDGFTRDGLLAYANLAGSRRITIGPWFHPQTQGYHKAAESLRWFDYWLKGVANGVLDEDPVHYWTLDAPPGTEWRSAKAWPVPEARPLELFPGPDGRLDPTRPAPATARYRVDYTTSLGSSNRWTATTGGAPGPVLDYPDLAANDQRALTFTSAPLPEAVEVTGHPVVRLRLAVDAPDTDVFAVLEEVGPDGFSNYVTEGRLRASHRRTGPAPYNRFGLPYHPSKAEDVAPLTGEPVDLEFDLLPTSKLFRAGHRIRLTLMGADNGNFMTPVTLPPPTWTVYLGGPDGSVLTLPVVPRR